MQYVLLFFLISLSWAGFDRTLDIYGLSPRADVIDGVAFPRNSLTLYRGGAEAQLDKYKAITSMLGGDEPVESILFSGIKLLLMKEDVPFLSAIRPNLEERGFFNAIDTYLNANKGRAYGLNEARRIAFKMIEDDLLYRFKSGAFFDCYVDYRSPKLLVFPQEMVYSTTYIEVANIYSRFITVIEDEPGHMLDLNYWNKMRHGSWVLTFKKWIDKGEFISPILIEAEKIHGYMEYLSQVPDYHIFRPLPNELDLAFMKLTVNGEAHVLVFDGRKATLAGAPAILKHKDKFYLADSYFDPEADLPRNLKRRSDLAALIAVIKLCPTDDSCSIRKEVFKNYPRSRRRLDGGMLNRITSITWKDRIAKVFFNPEVIPVDQRFTGAYAAKIPNSDELFPELLKEAASKPSLVVGDPSNSTPYILKWDLQGHKLGKDESIYLKLPNEVRAKKIKQITLLQRQDQLDNSTPLRGRFDSSPAYTSVQFYALTEEGRDNWRYWGGKTKFNNPKGAFFAGIKSEANMVPQTLTNWSLTKGHETDGSFNQVTNLGALRLLGVGTDPARIYTLELEFEK